MANKFIELFSRGINDTISALNAATLHGPVAFSRANKLVLEKIAVSLTTYPEEVAGNRPPPP